MLELHPKSTALVIVDLQDGILALPLTPNDGTKVVVRSVELAHALAEAGGLLVLVNVDYSAGYADRPNQPTDAPLRLPAEGLPRTGPGSLPTSPHFRRWCGSPSANTALSSAPSSISSFDGAASRR